MYLVSVIKNLRFKFKAREPGDLSHDRFGSTSGARSIGE